MFLMLLDSSHSGDNLAKFSGEVKVEEVFAVANRSEASETAGDFFLMLVSCFLRFLISDLEEFMSHLNFLTFSAKLRHFCSKL